MDVPMKLSARRLINSFIAKRCVSTESGNSLSYPGKPDKSYQVIIIGAGTTYCTQVIWQKKKKLKEIVFKTLLVIEKKKNDPIKRFL